MDKEKLMKEIAYTSFGRNSLVIGLISHAAALIIGMMPASVAGSFFVALYSFSWLIFVSGAYQELTDRGYRPLGIMHFYMAVVAAVIPFIGPLTGLMMLYNLQGSKDTSQEKTPFGFVASIFKLRANVLLVFLFIAVIFIVFALVNTKNDRYFKHKAAESILLKAAFAAELSESAGFVSEGKYFKVRIPADWGREDGFLLKEYKEYGVRLRAPGSSGLDYVLIDIAYYAGRHRTPERFIFDILNPSWPKGVVHTPVQDATISGMAARTFQIKTTRFPIAGIGDEKVDAMERYVVFPAAEGFFVLLYNAPVGIAEKQEALFQQVLHSFQPMTSVDTGPADKDEITEEEYSVYTDFFKTKHMPEIDSPVPLDFPAEGGLVYEKTSDGKKITAETIEAIEKSSGKPDHSLIESYNSRNAKGYSLKDKILVNTVTILTEERMEEIRKKGDLGKGFAQELTRSYPLEGKIIYLSRIGFDREMNNALFYAGSSSGVMGGSYFILMEKTGEGWRLKHAFLNTSWYY